MKKTGITLLLLTLLVLTAHSQKIDKLSFLIGAGWNLEMLNYSGTVDVSENPYTPVYEQKDTLFLNFSPTLHAGLNIPFYNGARLSIGTRLSAGVGFQSYLRQFYESDSRLIYDFPAFVYVRTYIWQRDLTFLAGYKYRHGDKPYAFPKWRVEFNADKQFRIGVEASLWPDSYYARYSNGLEKKVLSIREFGFTFATRLGK